MTGNSLQRCHLALGQVDLGVPHAPLCQLVLQGGHTQAVQHQISGSVVGARDHERQALAEGERASAAPLPEDPAAHTAMRLTEVEGGGEAQGTPLLQNTGCVDEERDLDAAGEGKAAVGAHSCLLARGEVKHLHAHAHHPADNKGHGWKKRSTMTAQQLKTLEHY